jgi:hypothetical protein
VARGDVGESIKKPSVTDNIKTKAELIEFGLFCLLATPDQSRSTKSLADCFAFKSLQIISKYSLFPIPPICRGFLQKYVVAAINTLNPAGIPFWAYFFRSGQQDGQKNYQTFGDFP